MKSPLTSAVVLCLGLVSCLLVGCAASTSVNGKVIQGNVGFVGLVDASDERFKPDGLAGISVAVIKNPQDGGVRIGEAKTDAKGNFSVTVSDQSALIRPISIAASGPGFQPASVVMNIPPSSQRILVILKPAGSTGTR